MKIGIVSNYQWLKQWDNYGTLLQNYALQRVLMSHGHDTFWILTVEKPPGPSVESFKRFLLKLYYSPRELVNHLKGFLPGCEPGKKGVSKIAAFNERHPRRFREFLDKHVAHTDRVYDAVSIVREPPVAEAYIVGSDNMWDTVSPVRFLQFGPPEALRLSYAVSAKWQGLSKYWYARATSAIEGIRSLSVRESDGVEVCGKLGRPDAVQVLDPTLLLSADDYRALIRDEPAADPLPEPFVFGYFLNAETLTALPWESMKEFALSEGRAFRVVPLQGLELVVPDEYLYTPSPAEWLNAIDRADYVLTNSFHGTVFSILMRKKFLVIPQDHGHHRTGMTRFHSMLKMFGLEDRIFRGKTAEELREAMNRPIDWEEVQARIAEEKGKSLDFLKRALGRES